MSATLPTIRPRDRAAVRAWLQRHHASATGVWIDYPKVHSGLPGPTYDDIVEEALCFGWIDGVVRKLESSGLKSLRLTPRQPGSIWARTNKVRVQHLEASGAMTDAGRAVIERAKADGSWVLLDDVEGHVIADDLAHALKAHPGARANLEGWSKPLLERCLYWVYSCKRPATREERIALLAQAAALGTPPPQVG